MSKQQTPGHNGHILLAVLWCIDRLDVAKYFPGNLSVVYQSFKHIYSDKEKVPLAPFFCPALLVKCDLILIKVEGTDKYKSA